MVRINGQLRPVFVRDKKAVVETQSAEKADSSSPGQIAAPFSGTVSVKVAVGDTVSVGQVVATIEAMKMEAGITSVVEGTVKRLAFSNTTQVEAGDLIMEIES
jgi:pyruvate carboxylase